MVVGSQDLAAMFQRALDYVVANLTVERLLIRAGLDPSNVTYEAIFNRLLELVLAGITFPNMLALIGGIFLILSFVARTMVPIRVLCIISVVFLLAASVFAGSVQHFLIYFLALPVNFVRLVQIRNLVKKARTSEQGSLSLDWLRPYMNPRKYDKGEVLFRKGDSATEMFLTVTGKFLVTEIGVEIPAGRILGELGFLSPDNHRTQSVECVEAGEVLTISYDKLREIYLQSPEFGYYFLRLTSDRLIQNHARLERQVEDSKAALAAATAAADAKRQDFDQVVAGASRKKISEAVLLTFRRVRASGVGANRRPDAGAGHRQAASSENVVVLMPRQNTGAGAADSSPPTTPWTEADASRRIRALAIVERHATFSAIGGFIPLPAASAATVAVVVVRMVRALNGLYGVPVERNRGFGFAVGLFGGVMPVRLAALASSVVVYLVPGFNLVGLAVSSVSGSAYVRTVGRMLVDHLEAEAALERKRLALKRVRRWPRLWPLRSARTS
jgi:CRP-like cAMP-binding protein/uncharacterized protein (DUF697 family)